MKLTAKTRNAIPSKDFALPGRRYPIEDRSHAANAKARASGKPEEAKVDAAVARKYPGMGKSHPGKVHGEQMTEHHLGAATQHDSLGPSK